MKKKMKNTLKKSIEMPLKQTSRIELKLTQSHHFISVNLDLNKIN